MDQDQDYFRLLVELMATLRSPEGCPWDREQTRETLKPMLIEEAFEVLEALDSTDPAELREELGDLLFQVIFHCRISSEKGEFDIDDVCQALYEKMVRRHPHVFGDLEFSDSAELLRNWEDLKAAEKEAGGRPSNKESLLDGVPEGMPALYRSYQITAKASRVGFDWPDLEGLRQKILEEFAEVQDAVQAGNDEKIKEEVGDLLFSALNVARWLQIDPETALSRANAKFEGRFKRMERYFASQGKALKEVTLDEMEAVWRRDRPLETASGESSRS